MNVRQWLQQLADSNQSTDKDAIMMQNLLHRIGLSKARVVLGVVYPTGYGYPQSIHTTAKELLKLENEK